MAFNGSGTFNPPIVFQPDTNATAQDMNTQADGFSTGLTNCITRDGQSPAKADIPFGGFRLTGVGTPTATTDAVTKAYADAVVAPGTVIMTAAPSAPTGYLLCDGAAYSRTTYAALFAAIGTTWGAGDGVTTFNVPDARGRAPIGVGTGSGLTPRVLAATGGEETHLLTTPEIPSHTHTDSGHTHGVTDPGHTHTGTYILNSGGSGGLGTGGPAGPASIPSATTGVTVNSGTANIQNTGGGGTHNNMQPWAAFNFIIKT